MSRLCEAVRCASPLPAALARAGGAGSRARRRRAAPAGPETEDRRGLHREDQGAPAGSADHDRAGRPPAGVRHRADAAEVPRPHRRHARRADLREGHLPLLRGDRQGVGPHRDVEHRQDRGRARHGRPRGRRRGDDQADRQVQGDDRVADRSAEDDRGAGAAADQDREADLLDHERHALARDRRSRDADGAAVPPGGRARRRSSSRSATTSSRIITPVIEVDGREKQVDTYYFNKKRARGRLAAAADVLGQVRRARQQPRRHGAVPGADAERDQDVPRVEADGHARPARGSRRISTRRPAPVPTTSRSIRSPSTSGGCSRRPK